VFDEVASYLILVPCMCHLESVYWQSRHLETGIMQPLFCKVAKSLAGLYAPSSAKQEDMVYINLRPASGLSASGTAAQ
ncbi:hypothetical protein ACJX0J_041793, partial [Zea mays]